MPYLYKKATISDLEYLWQKNISDNKGDNRWITWKKEAFENNATGRSVTFVITFDNDPIGEATLLFSPDCRDINGRTVLCDNIHVANVNALRIQKIHEGKGHISKLMKKLERHAIEKGYSYLTIGVEAKETRNLAIYLHWGYTEFVLSEIEDGELVLYYRKALK